MPKILTAINEEKIIKKIFNNKKLKNKNILYKEAIIDTIKKNKNIDILIISEKLPGEINFIKLIKNIKKINKKIKIIIILSNKKLEKELLKIKKIEIYYNNIFGIYELRKKLLKKNNSHFFNNIKNKIIIKIEKIINTKKESLIKNNVYFIFGDNKINNKILELIILKKLINKNKKIILINLKINNKKIKNLNKKILKIKIIKNKYYLKIKNKDFIKEKIINKNLKEIININKILKNKNYLLKIKILKNIIKKYEKNNYYIIFNSEKSLKNNKYILKNKYKNILIIENNINNLKKLNKNKINNEKINLKIINYNKNNISKYFYKIILKNKFEKIQIINLN